MITLCLPVCQINVILMGYSEHHVMSNSPEAMLMISLTMAFCASSYSSLFLEYSSLTELSLLQTCEREQTISWPEGQRGLPRPTSGVWRTCWWSALRSSARPAWWISCCSSDSSPPCRWLAGKNPAWHSTPASPSYRHPDLKHNVTQMRSNWDSDNTCKQLQFTASFRSKPKLMTASRKITLSVKPLWSLHDALTLKSDFICNCCVCHSVK